MRVRVQRFIFANNLLVSIQCSTLQQRSTAHKGRRNKRADDMQGFNSFKGYRAFTDYATPATTFRPADDQQLIGADGNENRRRSGFRYRCKLRIDFHLATLIITIRTIVLLINISLTINSYTITRIWLMILVTS